MSDKDRSTDIDVLLARPKQAFKLDSNDSRLTSNKENILMFTRKQYMNKEISHHDYYLQFADESTRQWIRSVIGLDRLNKSTDKHLNDIHLSIWDGYSISMAPDVRLKISEANNGGVSLSDAVCIAKACARQMVAAK